MKLRVLITTFVIGVLIFGLYSCEEESIDTERELMTALVNGNIWRCPEPSAFISKNQIVVYGTSADGHTIQLNIFSGNTGVYTLNETNLHEGSFYPNKCAHSTVFSSNKKDIDSGEAIINSINHDDFTISGSFKFNAYKETEFDKKAITKGVFNNVPYRYLNSVTTDNETNTVFISSINGNIFVATGVEAILSEGIIKIKGRRNDSYQNIILFIPETLTAGVHIIDSTNGPIQANFKSLSSVLKAFDGSCTIAEHDTATNIIRGSFYYNVNNEGENIELRNGYFETEYVEETK